MCDPCFAKTEQIPLPIPVAPPVIKDTLSFKSIINLSTRSYKQKQPLAFNYLGQWLFLHYPNFCADSFYQSQSNAGLKLSISGKFLPVADIRLSDATLGPATYGSNQKTVLKERYSSWTKSKNSVITSHAGSSSVSLTSLACMS